MAFKDTKADLKRMKQRNEEIERMLKKEAADMKKNPISKLMLLGPGDSGKTTLLKQMKILHGQGFSDDERKKEWLPRIYENIVKSIQSLVNACMNLDVDYQPEHEELVQLVDKIKLPVTKLTEQQIKAIKTLWEKDTGIAAIYLRSNEYTIQDTAKFFLDNIDRFTDPKYVPSNQDILMVRVQTKNVSETDFTIQNSIFRFYDVGGQRTLRAAWVPYFDDANAIVFIVAISSYDQVMEEDRETNRMVDAINLFDKICNNKMLSKVAMILLLNKSDLALEKVTVKKSSVRKHFPELDESVDEFDFEVFKEFFKEKFESVNQNPEEKGIYIHFTTSTDTELMSTVISMIIDIIVKSMLNSSGLM